MNSKVLGSDVILWEVIILGSDVGLFEITVLWLTVIMGSKNDKFRRFPSDAARCYSIQMLYRSADKSLARPTSRCILFDGENISFDASLVIYI